MKLRLHSTPKRCPRCRQTRHDTAFYQHRRDHLSSFCRDCQRATTRAAHQRRRKDSRALNLMHAVDRRRKRHERHLYALLRDAQTGVVA